ncbi:ester cyclase [Dyadobacter sp. 3J3]|uniref:ester cyclase n=1 Tax=Dyadobacter sp. 3J3 TaxID=2606600 RepID=UPI00135B4E1B|nr:ester cyclase [Dyadobacter sp. 3J3]
MNANKSLARRYFYQIMNGMNAETAHEILSEDFVFTLPTHPEPFHGPDGFLGLVGMLHGAFPDFYINPQEMVAGDDWVVTRWIGGGTHSGIPLLTVKGNVEASGNFFEIDGMTWHTIKDGKIVESIGHEDTLGLMLQLGVLPSDTKKVEPDLVANKNLATRYFEEIMTQGKLEVIEEILDPEFAFIIPTQPEPIKGYEAFTGFVKYLHNAFPDIKFTVMRQTSEGNKVASRWSIAGTHEGEFLGVPASGHHLIDYGIDIFTIKNGKIISVHVNENDFGLMQQLGAIPS